MTLKNHKTSPVHWGLACPATAMYKALFFLERNMNDSHGGGHTVFYVNGVPGIELCSNKPGHNPKTPVITTSMYHSQATSPNSLLSDFDNYIYVYF